MLMFGEVYTQCRFLDDYNFKILGRVLPFISLTLNHVLISVFNTYDILH